MDDQTESHIRLLSDEERFKHGKIQHVGVNVRDEFSTPLHKCPERHLVPGPYRKNRQDITCRSQRYPLPDRFSVLHRDPWRPQFKSERHFADTVNPDC
jgi:hypothetical protein